MGVAILVIALGPIIAGFALTSFAQDQAGRQMAALGIARGRLESYHAYTGLQWDGLQSAPETPDPIQPEYRVTLTVTTRSAGLKDLQVAVSWTDAKGLSHTVHLTTSVARRP